MRIVSVLAGAAALLAACADKSYREGEGDDADAGGGGGVHDGGPGTAADLGPLIDAPPSQRITLVYAHTAGELYGVNPDTLELALIAPFGWPGEVGSDSMTDIAVDAAGLMIGISFNRIYRVDPETAACTLLSTHEGTFNGLSFIAGGEVDPGAETLVAADGLSGGFYRIDPDTGVAELLGYYGGGLGSSGDIVSVGGAGTFATVTSGFGGDDLASVSPTTGLAAVIGSTGFSDIWGVGFWDGDVYGFTAGGEFVLVDTDTGAASLVEGGGPEWWGAAVTTRAPPGPD